MSKAVERWHSDRIHQPLTLVRYGHFGRPVLLFPTAGGDAEEAERFLMLNALEPLIAAGRMKLYTVDSVAGRAWVRNASPRHCSWLQNAFTRAIYHEVVPAIRADCRSADIEIIVAGASLGAFNAVSAITRFPDAFCTAIGMSGTYDVEPWLHGQMNQDYYFASPMHFLPNLGESRQLHLLRQRSIILAFGQGRWESPQQSWRMAEVLGAKGVPNRVDPWGHEWDHDWPTWRRQLPEYLDALL